MNSAGNNVFYTYDHFIQNELCTKQKSLNQREIYLFGLLKNYSESPIYPNCLPKFTTSKDAGNFELPNEAFEHTNLRDGLTIEQIELAIIALARFHAFSHMQLDPLNMVLQFTGIHYEDEEQVKDWIVNNLIGIEGNNDYFKKNESKLRNFCRKINLNENIHPDEKLKKKDKLNLKHPIVLCHGNFSAENLYFRHPNNAEEKEEGNDVLIINWELARPGNGLSDLSHLLLSSVNSDGRLQYFDHWLNLYISTFGHECKRQQKLGKIKFKGKNKFEHPKKQLQAQIQSQLIRVLPKLAWEYKQLGELRGTDEDDECQIERQKGTIFERMVGGFELIKNDFDN